MKTKEFAVLVCLMIVANLIGSACAKPAPTPAPAPAPAPKVFTLKFGVLTPPAAPWSKGQDWYLTEVEKRSKGRVQFERYWSSSLAPAAELLTYLTKGAADVGNILPGFHAGKTPLLTVAYLPALFEHVYEALMAMRDLVDQVPAVREELARHGVRYLSGAASTPMQVLSVKPVYSLKDIKGLKLRATGPQSKVVIALGGVPVDMDAAEMYDAIARGTMDGAVFNPAAIISNNLQDVGKYYYRIPLVAMLGPIVASQNTWDSLPKDIQNIMEKVGSEHPEVWQQIYEINGDGEGLEAMKAKRINIIAALPEDIAKLRQLAHPIWEEWVSDMEAQRLPGRQVLDTYVSLLAKYAALNPVFGRK